MPQTEPSTQGPKQAVAVNAAARRRPGDPGPHSVRQRRWQREPGPRQCAGPPKILKLGKALLAAPFMTARPSLPSFSQPLTWGSHMAFCILTE